MQQRTHQLSVHDATLCEAQELCEHPLQGSGPLALEQRGEEHCAAALQGPCVCRGRDALQLGKGNVQQLAVLLVGKVLPSMRCLWGMRAL